MATEKLMGEQAFLIRLAVDQFNDQYGRSLDPDECSIYSIRPDYGSEYGYEIITNTTGDYVKLRIFLSMSRRDGVSPYRLETTSSVIVNRLGDEVYVAMGALNQYYLDAGIYKFRWITPPAIAENFLDLMSGEMFILMSGERLSLMAQEVG